MFTIMHKKGHTTKGCLSWIFKDQALEWIRFMISEFLVPENIIMSFEIHNIWQVYRECKGMQKPLGWDVGQKSLDGGGWTMTYCMFIQ